MKEENNSSFSRKKFIKISALGAGSLMLGLACNNEDGINPDKPDYDDTSKKVKIPIPSSKSYRFGIMGDTQWVNRYKDKSSGESYYLDDGKNPATCAIDIINTLNEHFVKNGVKFVIQVGDLSDGAYRGAFYVKNHKTNQYIKRTEEDTYDIRARYTQHLYNAKIGFFPLRGNHDNYDTEQGDSTSKHFVKAFPQTQNGLHNNEKAQQKAFNAENPDEDFLPKIIRNNKSTFPLGENFSSPQGMEGLSYSFDFKNTRFIFLDQYIEKIPIHKQQDWITSRLQRDRKALPHAMVFSHAGLLLQDHVDNLFAINGKKNEPASDDGSEQAHWENTYIQSMYENGAKYHICGHDHMHDRSYIYTTKGHDGNGEGKKITQLICSSDSSKFYTPKVPSNDETYCGGKRQIMLSQELWRVGYYIVTVDEEHLDIEYYSANVGSIGNNILTTPDLVFTPREKFGYSLNGKEFLIKKGEPYTKVTDISPNKTQMKILNGDYILDLKDHSERNFYREVSTGWYKTTDSFSDILILRGMENEKGGIKTETFVLELSYKEELTQEDLKIGKLALVTDKKGIWIKAAEKNIYNENKEERFIYGPYKKAYGLGTYGIDADKKTVWAVINYNGRFAVRKV